MVRVWHSRRMYKEVNKLTLLRLGSFAIVLLSLCPVFHGQNVCSAQDDSFYESYLLQRMMVARIREFRGDATAKSLLSDLVEEATSTGMKLPRWVHGNPKAVGLKYPRAHKRPKLRKYDAFVLEASQQYGLPTALIKAVIHAESAFMNDAISTKGAQGLMQLMPETAAELGVVDSFDSRANVLGGSKLLKKHLKEFGSLKKALIAYNAGPEWVRRGKGIPRETRKYIGNVIRYYHIYKR